MTASETEAIPRQHDPGVFARNMAEVADLSGRIWAALAGGLAGAQIPHRPDPMNLFPGTRAVIQGALDNPAQVVDATLNYWQAQARLNETLTQKWLGRPQADEAGPAGMAEPGKRFSHHLWHDNPAFEWLQQSYLLAAGRTQAVVHGLGALAPRERRKVDFFTRQITEALNPANFLFSNPEVMEATLAEDGANLVRGLTMMLEDIERGGGRLRIRQTDLEAFEIGRNLAMTDGAVIWKNSVLELIAYKPAGATVAATPVLIIPPWINKYYILDLNPRKSLVSWLVGQGHQVFMLSWVNPGPEQKNETWESYMDAASAALDEVLSATGARQAHLASYCIGGTLTGTLLARMAAEGHARVASATFFTAQLDFEDAGDLQVFVDEQTLGLIDEGEDNGVLPASAMADAFNMLRASDLIWSCFVSNYLLGKEPLPFDLLYWNADSTAMPAGVHRFYLEQFYTRNTLARGEMDLAGGRLDLGTIAIPVYHVATREDHIAPAPSVFRGAKLMKRAELRFILAGSGHIAGVVNPPALGKYQFWSDGPRTAADLEAWLSEAKETPGSWWPDWDAWLKARSGGVTQAWDPEARAIGPAPGSYVRKRSA
jgi:polyhydroxyalkanoate synthase